MRNALELLDRGSIELLDQPVFTLKDETLTVNVRGIQAIVDRLSAVQAALVREIDGRGLVRASGALNASIWLRNQVHVSLATAHRLTALGAILDSRTDVAAALASGAITSDQALAIGHVLSSLPTSDLPTGAGAGAGAGAAIVDECAAALIDYAVQFEPSQLRRLGDRVLAHIDPDLADEQLRRRLEHEERQAARDRVLTLSPDGRGRTLLRGVLDTESAAILRAALEPLMTPIPTGAAGLDLRTAGARRADALVDVCRLSLRTAALPVDGGQPPQINVTIDYNVLAGAVCRSNAGTPGSGISGPGTSGPDTSGPGTSGPGTSGPGTPDSRTSMSRTHGAGGSGPDTQGLSRAGAGGVSVGKLESSRAGVGWLDTGAALSATAARRLACDARILPVVLGGAGVPIDIGRGRRLYTGAARTAILIRDGGCAFPGCDRPPRWTDIHHIIPWHQGGLTDRDNGVALCHHHHRLVHRDDWTVVMGADHRPEFIAPATVDPTRTRQRNPYHRRS